MNNLKTNKSQTTYLQYIRKSRIMDKVEINAMQVRLASSYLQAERSK